jgi:hypothetical protein
MKYGEETATLRLIDIYLAVYALLIAGALFTLYRSNVLPRLPPAWTIGSIIAAIVLGVLLRLLSARPKPRQESDDSSA